jgi:hypothetical protein
MLMPPELFANLRGRPGIKWIRVVGHWKLDRFRIPYIYIMLRAISGDKGK